MFLTEAKGYQIMFPLAKEGGLYGIESHILRPLSSSGLTPHLQEFPNLDLKTCPPPLPGIRTSLQEFSNREAAILAFPVVFHHTLFLVSKHFSWRSCHLAAPETAGREKPQTEWLLPL